MPSIHFINVDLPAPFGPTKARRSPCRMVKDTLEKISRTPKDFPSFSIRICSKILPLSYVCSLYKSITITYYLKNVPFILVNSINSL